MSLLAQWSKTLYYPLSDGMVERLKKNLCCHAKYLSEDIIRDWDEIILMTQSKHAYFSWESTPPFDILYDMPSS